MITADVPQLFTFCPSTYLHDVLFLILPPLLPLSLLSYFATFGLLKPAISISCLGLF